MERKFCWTDSFVKIYDGENYDARKKVRVWTPVIAIADLGTARLTPKPFPPVREIQLLAVQKITEPKPGRFVFDLGQNMVGWARIKVPAEKDKMITIRFAEMLNNDGTLYTENYRGAKSTDTYISAKNAIIEWEPHITFHGFRYVELLTSTMALESVVAQILLVGICCRPRDPTRRDLV